MARNTQKRPAEESDDGEEDYERRREQVRRAQRKHRDRKAAYIAALEQECSTLRAEVNALRSGEFEDFPCCFGRLTDSMQ
jgi:hypothetical protein